MNWRDEAEAREAMTPNLRTGLIGASISRLNARRFVVGRGRYADDLRWPRLLHAAFVRSPFAHAVIGRVDLDGIHDLPGVAAAFDGRAIAAVCKPWTTRLATLPQHVSSPQPALAIDRALWQGHPVAIVLAASRAEAEDAAAAIQVDWTEQEPIVDAERALAGAPFVHDALGTNVAFDHRVAAGDATLFEAARLVRRRLRFTRHTGVPLESRAIVADFDAPTRRLTLHHSHQAPHQMRAIFAECLGLNESDVRIVVPDVGGGYGIKLHAYDDEMAVAAAAMLVGRPIKFVADRMESFVSDIHARGHDVDASIAIDAEGRIIGFRIDDIVEVGAYSVYPRTSILEGMQVLTQVGAPYVGRAHQARLRVVYQNKIGTSSYRGVGQPIACGVTEQLVDAAAAALDIDPSEFRRRNYRSASRDGGETAGGLIAGELSHEACLDRLLDRMRYRELRDEQRRARERGRCLGIGLAAFIEMNSPGPGFYGAAGVRISAADGCTLRLEPSGTLTCITSTCDQGQGSETGIQQLLAEALGLPLGDVRMVLGDTATMPVGGGTFASRGLALGGEAALAAAEALRERLINLAAAMHRRDVGSLVLDAGAIRDVKTSEVVVPLAALAGVMHYQQHTLPSDVPADWLQPAITVHETPKRPYLVANGIQASFVEVDPDTGFIRLLGHWVVEDCGRIINPLLADEQLRGGVIQGIGAALFEECRYDDRGQLVNGTLVDYLVPMAFEMPDIVIDHVETPVPGTRVGAKGIGEAGTIGAAAAVANAVNDALRPFGAVLTEQPFTPERVLRALKKVLDQR